MMRDAELLTTEILVQMNEMKSWEREYYIILYSLGIELE